MAKKKNNNNNENRDTNNEDNTNEGEKKKEGGDAEKKNDKKGSITVVLKVDMHCEGCASKIVKWVRAFEGVETVKAETSANKLTIVGSVDPSKIRDKLSQKTKKKVDLVSPQPKKDKDKETKEENNKNKDKNNVDDKKPKEKEVPVTTAVLKLNLHCRGCINRIRKTVSKAKGVIVSLDEQKGLVAVKGTMDVKALTENLKEKLKRPVEIVPPKKEKEEKESNGGDNNHGGGKKKKGGGGGGGDGDVDGGGKGVQEADGGWKMDGNRMNYMMGIPGPGYGYGYQFPMHGGYEYGYPVGGFHAPQMFSDENPNACAVM